MTLQKYYDLMRNLLVGLRFQFKEGDEVVISKDAQEICEVLRFGWYDNMNKMVGKRVEIKKVFKDFCRIWDEDKNWWSSFPLGSFCFANGETGEEVQEVTVADIEKLVGKKIKIIK